MQNLFPVLPYYIISGGGCQEYKLYKGKIISRFFLTKSASLLYNKEKSQRKYFYGKENGKNQAIFCGI